MRRTKTTLHKKYKHVDKKIGRNLRMWRGLKNKSQIEIAEHLGISFQQVQKYESGQNRISASTLVSVCEFLDVSPMEVIGEEEQKTESYLVKLSKDRYWQRLFRLWEKIDKNEDKKLLVSILESCESIIERRDAS